ncbi:Phosphatidylglycerol/phosphatidylinositol transfer protein [Naganishia albida]|nr:Phosphatidylglycerol/phosphatidylinositol transfer protein [Naganishia albida]
MKLLTLSALVFSTASLISATPAPIAGPQAVVDLVSWGASALTEQLGHHAVVEDDGMKTTASWSWTDCGLATDAVQIKEINVNPDPPSPGKNLTVNVKAEVLKTVEEGAWAHVVVKLGLIKLLQKDFDICEEARNANATVQCPIQPGSYDVNQTVELPREIPRAKFAVNVQAYDKDDEDLACVNLFVDFLPGRG